MPGTRISEHPEWAPRVCAGDDPITGNPRQVSRTFRSTTRPPTLTPDVFVSAAVNGQTLVTASTDGRRLPQPMPAPVMQPVRRPPSGDIASRSGASRPRPALPIEQFEARHLDRAYRQWLEEGPAPCSTRYLHRVLPAALRQVVKWAGPRGRHPASHPSSPAIAAACDPDAGSGPGSHFVGRTPGAAVLAAAVAAVAIATTTGLRGGELAGLQWPDLDLDGGRLCPPRHQERRSTADGWPGHRRLTRTGWSPSTVSP